MIYKQTLLNTTNQVRSALRNIDLANSGTSATLGDMQEEDPAVIQRNLDALIGYFAKVFTPNVLGNGIGNGSATEMTNNSGLNVHTMMNALNYLSTLSELSNPSNIAFANGSSPGQPASVPSPVPSPVPSVSPLSPPSPLRSDELPQYLVEQSNLVQPGTASTPATSNMYSVYNNVNGIVQNNIDAPILNNTLPNNYDNTVPNNIMPNNAPNSTFSLGSVNVPAGNMTANNPIPVNNYIPTNNVLTNFTANDINNNIMNRFNNYCNNVTLNESNSIINNSTDFNPNIMANITFTDINPNTMVNNGTTMMDYLSSTMTDNDVPQVPAADYINNNNNVELNYINGFLNNDGLETTYTTTIEARWTS